MCVCVCACVSAHLTPAPNQVRWTMSLRMPSFGPLRSLWDPPVSFTGVSVYGISPSTGRVATHTDYWDSLPRGDAQKFLSTDAVRDFVGMAASLEQTPELESPEYALLLRTADYEVRERACERIYARARKLACACI